MPPDSGFSREVNKNTLEVNLMKFVKLALLSVAAATILSACCHTANTKCYPYPLYDYSPARICGANCQ